MCDTFIHINCVSQKDIYQILTDKICFEKNLIFLKISVDFWVAL